MKENLPVIAKKNITKVGDSYYVAIPKAWLDQHKLKERDEVILLADKIIRMYPGNDKEIIKKLHKQIEKV